jgi:hypothetical protein
MRVLVPAWSTPALARGVRARTLDAGVPAGWVSGDEVYSTDPALALTWSTARSGTSWRWPVTTASVPGAVRRVDALAARLPGPAW